LIAKAVCHVLRPLLVKIGHISNQASNTIKLTCKHPYTATFCEISGKWLLCHTNTCIAAPELSQSGVDFYQAKHCLVSALHCLDVFLAQGI
jgi:hypothetical protein